MKIQFSARGESIRTITDRHEIDEVLTLMRRAKVKRKVTLWTWVVGVRQADSTTWRRPIGMSVMGVSPEQGVWTIDLETGEVTFLDPFIQSIYRMEATDRELLLRVIGESPPSALLRR